LLRHWHQVPCPTPPTGLTTQVLSGSPWRAIARSTTSLPRLPTLLTGRLSTVTSMSPPLSNTRITTTATTAMRLPLHSTAQLLTSSKTTSSLTGPKPGRTWLSWRRVSPLTPQLLAWEWLGPPEWAMQWSMRTATTISLAGTGT